MTLEALTLIASLCGGQMPCNQRMLKCVEKQQMALAVHSADPVLDPDEWSYTGSIAACVKRDRAPSLPPHDPANCRAGETCIPTLPSPSITTDASLGIGSPKGSGK